MAVTFSADEIFEIAEHIERNGAKFYRKAAQGVDSAEFAKLFAQLAELEVEHEKTFAAMRTQLSARELPIVYDPDDEVALYLRALADGRVFDIKSDPSEKLTGRETPADILNMAIGLEKDSIVLYLGLAEYVPADGGKDKVNAIIKQEMGHVTLLSDKLKNL